MAGKLVAKSAWTRPEGERKAAQGNKKEAWGEWAAGSAGSVAAGFGGIAGIQAARDLKTARREKGAARRFSRDARMADRRLNRSRTVDRRAAALMDRARAESGAEFFTASRAARLKSGGKKSLVAGGLIAAGGAAAQAANLRQHKRGNAWREANGMGPRSYMTGRAKDNVGKSLSETALVAKAMRDLQVEKGFLSPVKGIKGGFLTRRLPGLTSSGKRQLASQKAARMAGFSQANSVASGTEAAFARDAAAYAKKPRFGSYKVPTKPAALDTLPGDLQGSAYRVNRLR